jgi:hypothetical protein
MFSLSLYCLPVLLFLFTTLVLFLFFPLKTQIPLCYHLRFEFFGTFAIKSCIYTQLSSLISPYSCNNLESCWMYFNKILFRGRGLPLTKVWSRSDKSKCHGLRRPTCVSEMKFSRNEYRL